ncbi:YesK family protein [Alkalibacillus silvisoli]|uniref:YesK-like protein n=1 Tax=Alkalibacillus silvisoli TaxID=392823 RepID=A0ABN0ZZX7_9BACI
MNGTIQFLIITLVAYLLILFISKLLKEKAILVPISSTIISIIMFAISFTVEGFEGLGYGFLSLAVFLGSLLALITLTIVISMKKRKLKET